MNKQEFEKMWNESLIPNFNKLEAQDRGIFLRNGSYESLCRTYNDIKNATKRQFMLKNGKQVVLDRHKIAACLANAIVLDKPICKKIEDDYTGTEDEFMIANEALAIGVALSVMRAYIKLKLEKKEAEFMKREEAYQKICDEDFIFPQTIMKVDYIVAICWAWHHNIINGHFDVLGTANLLFMIENYSVEAYVK